MTILVTHWDTDGIFCLYLFYKKFGEDIKVYFSGPRKIETTLLKIIKENDKEEALYITDIAATQEAIYLSSYFKSVIWIDHHVWNDMEFTSRVKIYVKSYKSAARVVAEYFGIEDPYLDFVDHIDSNQIENDIERDFRDLVVAIRNEYPKSYEVWFKDIAKKLYNGKSPNDIIKEYKSLLSRFREFLRKVEDTVVLNTKLVKVGNSEFFIVNTQYNVPSFYIVEILQKRLKPELDYIIILYGDRAEIRTTNNKNVLTIAKIFGGGGHEFAAGFMIQNEDELIKKLRDIFK